LNNDFKFELNHLIARFQNSAYNFCTYPHAKYLEMSRQPNRLLTYGLPLVTLTVGGWLGIAHFMQGRIDVEV